MHCVCICCPACGAQLLLLLKHDLAITRALYTRFFFELRTLRATVPSQGELYEPCHLRASLLERVASGRVCVRQWRDTVPVDVRTAAKVEACGATHLALPTEVMNEKTASDWLEHMHQWRTRPLLVLTPVT